MMTHVRQKASHRGARPGSRHKRRVARPARARAPRRRQLTIRLEPELARAVEDRARAAHVSLNEAALQLLRQAAGVGAAPGGRYPRGAIGHALDKYFGTWTKEEAEEFDRNVAFFGKIDEDMWR